MNCRNTSTLRNPRTWGWGKAAALGALFALGLNVNAQVNAYSFAQTSGTYTEITGGTVIATATTNSGATSLDDVNYAVNFAPFSFTFNGTAYTSLNLNSNGYITFGATLPAAGFPYTPISNTAAYAGAVAAFGGDINGMFNIGGFTSQLRWEVLGSSPNRELVLQWKDFRPAFSTSATVSFRMNFQIRLKENGSVVEVVYGPSGIAGGAHTSSSTRQIGLRGATNAAFNNRTNTTLVPFTASTAGGANTATQAYNIVGATPGMPSNGLTYTWTPPVPCTGLPSLTGGTAAATVTSGCGSVATSTLSVTGASGGASGFTYQWRSGPVGGPYTTNLGTALTQVVTSVTSTTAYVRDIICTGGPATATSSEVVITVNPTVTAGVSASPAGPFCGAASTALTATGGLTYAWSPATGLDAVTGATVNSTTTSTRTYTVTATGVGGCTGTANVTVTVNPLPLVISTTATPNPVCNGGNSNLNVAVGGTSTVSGSGLTISDGNSSPYPGTIAVSGVAGSIIDLRVTMTNFNHTWPNDVDVVLFGPTGAHSIIFTDAIGGSGGVTARNYTFAVGATALPTTGFPASGTYGVVNGGTFSGAGTPSAVTNTGLGVFNGTNPNGTWSLFVFDDTGGDIGTIGSWSLEISTGAPVASYSWSPVTYLNDPTLPNPTASGVVTTENYTVTVTATNGCTTTGSVSLVPSAPITAASISGPLAYCAGGSTTLTAVPADGGAPFTYLWSPGGETSASIVVTAPGNYSCQVSDNCAGSVNTGTVTVVENPVPTASASSNSPVCTGNPINLDGTSDIGTSFTWSGPNGFANTSEDPSIPAAALNNAGAYTFIASTAFCSSAPTTTTVVVNETPGGVTANVSDNVVCDGDLVDLTSTPSIGSGTILSENFNAAPAGWTTQNLSTGGTPANAAWTQRPNGYNPAGWALGAFASNDASQFYFTDGDAQGSGSTANTRLISPSMDLSQYTSANLSFFHFYRDIGDTGDSAVVEVSTNGGTTWVIAQAYTTTQGAFNAFASANVDLTAYAGQAAVQVRFRYRGTWDWGWALDNVTVTGTPIPYTYAWTSAPSGFTSAVQNPTGVSASPLPSTYTVTVSTAFCSASASVTVNPDLTDSDGDNIADCVDTCPNFPGQNGDACDAGPGFVLGNIVNCACVGQVCTTDLVLEVKTDGNGSQTTWELRQQGTNTLVQSGGGTYPNNVTLTDNTCLPNGCYYLRVLDGGGDGILNGGGYILRTLNGAQRIIDNRGNFSSGSVSAVIGNGGFCLPLGTDKLIFTSCDKLDWVNNQFIVAAENPAVTAEFGVSNTTSGYQFWWFDPNGTYGYSKFRSHATSDGFGTGATRACHARINNWSPAHIPANVMMNVNVRGRVNGVNSNWGPVCRFMIDPLRAACPFTKLVDIPGNTNFSCGVTRTWGGSSLSKVVAKAVDGATQYQFRWNNAELAAPVIRTTTTPVLQLNWNPALDNGTYQVQVRAFKNGVWCVTSLPWGDECNVTITGSPNAMSVNGGSTVATGDAKLAMFPNPNNGEQLTVSLSAV
ncbi:MAG: proprotein convertase P-domain-containing protein, partial [Flavobacteriales bacterium]